MAVEAGHLTHGFRRRCCLRSLEKSLPSDGQHSALLLSDHRAVCVNLSVMASRRASLAWQVPLSPEPGLGTLGGLNLGGEGRGREGHQQVPASGEAAQKHRTIAHTVPRALENGLAQTSTVVGKLRPYSSSQGLGSTLMCPPVYSFQGLGPGFMPLNAENCYGKRLFWAGPPESARLPSCLTVGAAAAPRPSCAVHPPSSLLAGSHGLALPAHLQSVSEDLMAGVNTSVQSSCLDATLSFQNILHLVYRLSLSVAL